jgi:invasion protein IalB
MIQWIDDAADIADDDDLNITINQTTIAAKIALTANEVGNVAVWTMTYPLGLMVNNLVVTTIDHGTLLVFIE